MIPVVRHAKDRIALFKDILQHQNSANNPAVTVSSCQLVLIISKHYAATLGG
jgi:hypothetical protein